MDNSVVVPADPSRLYWFSEGQWRQIEAVFPRPNGNKGFAQAVPNRQACEAVLFRARTGCPWRDLPAAYGPWHTIYMRWRRSCRRWRARARRPGHLGWPATGRRL